jgi:hypothetical protein
VKRSRSLLAVLVATAVGASTVGVAYAAFTAVASNAGNSIASATVEIADNDAGSAMLSLANATPGSSDTGCIRVTYTGSLSATVRLYGTVTGTAAPHVILTVTRGTDPSPSFDSCAGFTPDATDHIGAGPGVVWSGLLSTFPSTWAGGVVDPATWATSAARSYKFVVSPVDRAAAEGLSSTFAPSWEARNT